MLLDNHSLGKISKEQLAAGLPVWHTSLHNPDWAAYADLCGATGIRVEHRERLDDAFDRAVRRGRARPAVRPTRPATHLNPSEGNP